MNFAVTEDGSFERCPRQAWLTSKNGLHLQPMFSPVHLATGTLVHKAHQSWLEKPEVSLLDHAYAASVRAVDMIKARYKKRVGAEPKDAELESTHESIAFALAMCENYQIKWGTPLPDDYKFLSAEQKIEIPVPGTEHECELCVGRRELIDSEGNERECPMCNGTGTALHNLEGKLDGLIQHKSGRIDILEHKTYGSRPNEWGLAHNAQFLRYVWMVAKLNLGTGMPCIAYDGMWRRDKTPKGKTFNDLFLRITLQRTQHELDELEHFMPVILNKMYELYCDPEKYAYPNRPWNGCYDCSMDGKDGKGALCTAISRGEDWSVIKEAYYTERDDDTEEEVEEAA